MLATSSFKCMAGYGFTYAPAENIQRMSLFPAYSVSDKDYRFLSRFSNLEVLCLRDIDLDKVRFEFPVLPKLVEICIDDNRVTPRVLEWLRQQPRLKRVKLWSVFSPPISIASARIGCSKLVEIDPGVRTGKAQPPHEIHKFAISQLSLKGITDIMCVYQ